MGKLAIMRKYFDQELGEFYGHAINRLMLYPFLFSFFLIECIAFWLVWQGPSFLLNYMAFTIVYSLHKAIVYTSCTLGADLIAHFLFYSWGAYHLRKVGKQWIIWSMGLSVGFYLQQIMVNKLIILYAPNVVLYFRAHPDERVSVLTMLLVLTPYWCSVLFITMWVAISKQRIQKVSDSLFVTQKEKERNINENVSTDRSATLVDGILNFQENNGDTAIAFADITHVTVEDHYCNINYVNNSGINNKMIRLPLKEMMLKLPTDHFLRIHRSHVVNVSHISHLNKCGRDYKIILHNQQTELPISRSRFKHLLPLLKVNQSSG